MSQPSSERPADETTSVSQPGGVLSQTAKINVILLCILLLVGVGILISTFLTSILDMLAASLIVAYLLLGPVSWLDQKLRGVQIRQWVLPPAISRALAILCVYVLCLGMGVISVIRVVPPLTHQVQDFAEDLPKYWSQVEQQAQPQEVSPNSEEGLRQSGDSQAKPSDGRGGQAGFVLSPAAKAMARAQLLSSTYHLALQKVMNNFQQQLARAGGLILDVGTTTLSGLIYTLTTLVLVFYLLHDGEALKRGFVDLMPTRNEAAVEAFLERLHVQLYSFIRGQSLMGLLSGSLMYLLLLGMGIKYALLLSFIFGLASILPVIGTVIALIPIILIIALHGHLVAIIPILLATGVFYLVKAYWIWPRVMHRKLDLHPILFIITFLICLKLLGLMGILLAFPLSSMVSVAMDTLKASYRTLLEEPGGAKLPSSSDA